MEEMDIVQRIFICGWFTDRRYDVTVYVFFERRRDHEISLSPGVASLDPAQSFVVSVIFGHACIRMQRYDGR